MNDIELLIEINVKEAIININNLFFMYTSIFILIKL